MPATLALAASMISRARIPLNRCRFYLVRHVLLLLGAPHRTLRARACLPQRTVMCTVYCEIWRVYPGMGGSIACGRALLPPPRTGMGRQARRDTLGEGRKATFGRR